MPALANTNCSLLEDPAADDPLTCVFGLLTYRSCEIINMDCFKFVAVVTAVGNTKRLANVSPKTGVSISIATFFIKPK